MKLKPRWLSWNCNEENIGDNILFRNMDSWMHAIDWFLSSPHLTDNKAEPLSYQAVELWALGMGLIIRALIGVYEEGYNVDKQGSEALQMKTACLHNWIEVQDSRAKVVFGDTKRALERRYRAAVDPNNAEAGPSRTPREEGTPNLGTAETSVTRSMNNTPAEEPTNRVRQREKRARRRQDPVPAENEPVAKRVRRRR